MAKFKAAGSRKAPAARTNAAAIPCLLLIVAGVAQLPAPSHFAAGVSVVVGLPFEQVAALHCVPAGHLVHCPEVHCPVVPQPD